jgi:hypothetical protein
MTSITLAAVLAFLSARESPLLGEVGTAQDVAAELLGLSRVAGDQLQVVGSERQGGRRVRARVGYSVVSGSRSWRGTHRWERWDRAAAPK